MKALVLFSGGVDSSTCLAIAVAKYGAKEVLALSVSYGQKHSKELEAAQKIAEYYGVMLKTIDLSKIFEDSNCSLLQGSTEDIPTESYDPTATTRRATPTPTAAVNSTTASTARSSSAAAISSLYARPLSV